MLVEENAIQKMFFDITLLSANAEFAYCICHERKPDNVLIVIPLIRHITTLKNIGEYGLTSNLLIAEYEPK